jgi:putative nucleotidyltransferase with HDIG domain
VKKNGETIWVNDQTRVVKKADGTIAFYQGVVLDITEKKRFELLLEENSRTMRRAWDQTIEVLSTTVEMRDPYTAGHQRRVALLAGAIARKIGVPEQTLFAVERASLLHDIGKIEVPAEILSKPGSLSAIEMGIVKQHVEAGWKILKNIALPWPLAEIVYQHHELLDGSGYPRGLKDGEICLEARIITVADIVEAMASHRPFRPSRGLEAALAEIEHQRGVTLDEKVVNACLELFRQDGFVLETL